MFIAKNKDLIILANDSLEALQKQLQFMVYTSIEETDIQYELVNGAYVTPEEKVIIEKEKRIAEIKKELDTLDLKSIRAIRANDTEYINKYEQEAQALREELNNLEGEV